MATRAPFIDTQLVSINTLGQEVYYLQDYQVKNKAKETFKNKKNKAITHRTSKLQNIIFLVLFLDPLKAVIDL